MAAFEQSNCVVVFLELRLFKPQGFDSEPRPEVFVTFRQFARLMMPVGAGPLSEVTLVVRTTGDPLALVPQVRSQVIAADPQLAIYNITTMERQLALTAARVDPSRFCVEIAYLLPWKTAFVTEIERREPARREPTQRTAITYELKDRLRPPIISWGDHADFSGPAHFQNEFEWQGTEDIARYLAVPEAIRFQRDHDWDAVRERAHGLVRRFREEAARIHGQTKLIEHGRMEQLREVSNASNGVVRRRSRLREHVRSCARHLAAAFNPAEIELDCHQRLTDLVV